MLGAGPWILDANPPRSESVIVYEDKSLTDRLLGQLKFFAIVNDTSVNIENLWDYFPRINM